MFGLVAGLYNNYMAPAQLNILLVGQERVGKTTLLERVKVTEFSKNPTTTTSKTATASNQNAGRRFLCPSPGRYANAKDNDDDDENDDHQDGRGETEEQQQLQLHKSLLTEDTLTPSGVKPKETNRQSSMEDIPIDDDDDDDDDDDNCNSSIVESDFDDEDDDDTDSKEYDLKPGAHMLPKDKIRPTIGMNLAKLEMCTAKCHFWDLGGKMKDIRNRYYADADAVVCIVPFHISSPRNGQLQQDNNGRSTTEQQQQQQQQILLEELQTQLSEFVPVLVFVNIMRNNNNNSNLESAQYYQSIISMGSSMATELQKTNPNVRVVVGSAKTGQGVRSAFEWLIPVAKQQKVKKQQFQLDKYHD